MFKITKFHPIPCVEIPWKRRLSAEFRVMRPKLCGNFISTKFPHQERRWNYGILCSVIVSGLWPKFVSVIWVSKCKERSFGQGSYLIKRVKCCYCLVEMIRCRKFAKADSFVLYLERLQKVVNICVEPFLHENCTLIAWFQYR